MIKLSITKNILLGLIFISCSSEEVKQNQFNAPVTSERQILIDELKIDTLNFKSIESSYTGFFSIHDDTINFIDRRFGWIFKFDKEGKYIEQVLGQGQGPYEINTSFIDGYLHLPSGKNLFWGSSFDVHIHNASFNRLDNFILGWTGNQSQQVVRAEIDPDPNEFGLYTLDYQNFLLRSDGMGNVYVPIYGEAPHFNGFSSHEYYKEGRILARLNLKSNQIDELVGYRSPEYLKYKFLGHHSFFSYDISNDGKFYISHEIDSMIYVYNSDFQNINRFGNQGKSVESNYIEQPLLDMERIRHLYFVDRPTSDWYGHIEYFDQFDILFRSYNIGDENYDGLQIYKANKLVADVKVPDGLIIKGYIEPYFFSDAMLHEEELSLKCYRFKLPENLITNE